ncbi:hypothetical protein CCACVL1_08547 [Corchorus capsularis]|uniref:Uncharacterized protein n=1 Tax=Corchorus capsularis TaxID=210143 RepID=A0A1R3IZY2_COCAP|nr:hypothetical protein CCACVL1_08547 [Corchorus capsularis]
MASSSQGEMPSIGPHPSSQNSVFEEKPEAGKQNPPSEKGGEVNFGGTLIRRAVSDSHALSKALLEDSIPGLAADYDDEENSVGLTSLESAFVYGPNSPRKKGASISDYSLVSALSESVSQDYQQSVEEPARAKTAKRNSWQHSRDRKAQYIAELERTINILQVIAPGYLLVL